MREVSGNEAVACGALAAGISLASGYPGTPSSEALAELLSFSEKMKGSGRAHPYVQWSVNEKVALEIAAGAAWAGKRALATMKMSGANVALDSLISIAYSGTRGGLVIYIADDPGAEAGMPEQDTRLIALFTNLPVLEPSDPRRSYELTRYAFELSESCELPVIVRSVTSVAHAVEALDIDPSYHDPKIEAEFHRDIGRFTKAGAEICMNQHRDLLHRNDLAVELLRKTKINRSLSPSGKKGKSSDAAVISSGAVNQVVGELHGEYPDFAALLLEAVNPLDEELIETFIETKNRLLILEELEPVIEKQVRSLAQRINWKGRIIGKLDGKLPRIGRYSSHTVREGLDTLSGAESAVINAETPEEEAGRERPSVHHPITFCEGCPHRGTYLALGRALKKTKLGKNKTVVTGDIGCTILGMNPPFDSCWTEVSMGSSIGFAQGFSLAGIRPPLVAAIGDSTFFHAGIPPLINAVQHGTDMLLIILDNGWTSMTGFQINPGTDADFQQRGGRRVDISALVQSLGVDMYREIRPFRQEESVNTLAEALTAEGVRVVVSKEECALTRLRREERRFVYRVDPDKCTFCRVCIRETGCPALYVEETGERPHAAIDRLRCTACSLCYSACSFDAISPIKIEKEAQR